jgi:hypothetical protein
MTVSAYNHADGVLLSFDRMWASSPQGPPSSEKLMRQGVVFHRSATCCPLLKLGVAFKSGWLQTSIVVIAYQRPVASKILIPKRQVPPATSLQIKNNEVNPSITVSVQPQKNCLTLVIWSY